MKARLWFNTALGGGIWLWLAVVVWMVTACAKIEKPPEIAYVETTTLPAKLAVMPAQFLPLEKKDGSAEFAVDPNSDKATFIADLARGVVHNQLAGKGFDMRILNAVDQKLKGLTTKDLSAQELCAKLDVEGLVYPDIVVANMVTGVAYDLFKIEAKIRMVGSSGKELGSWKDTASKRKIALPTSPVGVAATIAGALLNESARKQMRLVIYDWGWKVTQFVPDSPLGKTLPEVVSVDSNIDKGIFAAGQQIKVEVVAEKDLICTFDLGSFKQGIPLSAAGGGTYKGGYVVQEGDQIANQSMRVHLYRSNGVERIWNETGTLVTIDGVLPPAPESIETQASRSGVNLKWTLPQGEQLKAFVVEKSTTAVGDYTTLATTKDLHYLDSDVAQGKTYYYRVRSVDAAGNRSQKKRTVQVVMPYYDEVELSGTLSGTLVAGVYRVKESAVIASGDVLGIGPGAKLIMASGARIVVNGILKVKGSASRPAALEGEKWHGIVVADRGQADFAHAIIRGCAACVTVADGSLVLHDTVIKGGQGDGIVVKEDGLMAMKDVRISGFERGLALEGGKSAVEKSTLTGNSVGIDVVSGAINLNQTNVYNNVEVEIRSGRKIVLEDNYLGAADPKELNISGDVLVKSLLDAPHPHGRRVVLVDESTITPEVREQRFATHKKNGIEAFEERRYGDAYQSLSKALKIREDKEVYLYLAYTQSSLGEDKKMAATLDRGISAFPYEVRLYQVYVKYLAANGQKEKALSLLEKAVRLNPEDQSLGFMKQYIESMEQ